MIFSSIMTLDLSVDRCSEPPLVRLTVKRAVVSKEAFTEVRPSHLQAGGISASGCLWINLVGSDSIKSHDVRRSVMEAIPPTGTSSNISITSRTAGVEGLLDNREGRQVVQDMCQDGVEPVDLVRLRTGYL